MLGLLTHCATYIKSGNGSVNVTKYTISSTGTLEFDMFPLSEIHAKSPGVSHFALYNDSGHYNCAENTTPLAKALRNRADMPAPISDITGEAINYYYVVQKLRSICMRKGGNRHNHHSPYWRCWR